MAVRLDSKHPGGGLRFWAIACLCATVLCFIAWFVWRDGALKGSTAVAPASAANTAKPSFGIAPLQASEAQQPAGSAAAPTSAAPAAVLASENAPIRLPSVRSTCPAQREKAKSPISMEDFQALLQGKEGKPRNLASIAWIFDLLQQPKNAQEAAATYYLTVQAFNVEAQSCLDKPCASDLKKDFALRRQAAEHAAKLALSSLDPVAYDFGLRTCWLAKLLQQEPAVCEQLSVRNWAQLDAANAVPWLRLASSAKQQGDIGGMELALLRATQATNWRLPSRFLERFIFGRLPPEIDSDQLFQVTQFMGGEAVLSEMVDVYFLQRHCQEADANRLQMCQKLSNLFLSNSLGLEMLPLAVKLIERLNLSGPAAERTRAMAAKVNAWEADFRSKHSKHAEGPNEFCAMLDEQHANTLAVLGRP